MKNKLKEIAKELKTLSTDVDSAKKNFANIRKLTAELKSINSTRNSEFTPLKYWADALTAEVHNSKTSAEFVKYVIDDFVEVAKI